MTLSSAPNPHDSRKSHLFYIAHSLAELYIETFRDAVEGQRWLERTQQHMVQVDDGNYVDDLDRLREALRQFRSDQG